MGPDEPAGKYSAGGSLGATPDLLVASTVHDDENTIDNQTDVPHGATISEVIEPYNSGKDAVDLSNWSLTDGVYPASKNADPGEPVFGGVMPPNRTIERDLVFSLKVGTRR